MTPRELNQILNAMSLLKPDEMELPKFELGGNVESSVLEIEEYGFPFVGSNYDERIIDLGDCEMLNELTSTDVFLALSCGYDIDKIKQNNWRKIHGLPMKRRKYHGK